MENNQDAKKSGFLLIDKPNGWTSFDIVAKLRGITGIKKIGHAGTLDPLATGLLIVAVGREATREIDKFLKKDKVYEARIVLGAESDTYDAEGNIEKISDNQPTLQHIKKTLNLFKGEIKQIPPMYSAKKVKGKKLYELARKGIEIDRDPISVNIFNIELLEYKYPHLQIKVHCSSGTYIRSLAHDIGKELGVGGYIDELRRTKIGEIDVNNSIVIKDLTKENWIDNLVKL